MTRKYYGLYVLLVRLVDVAQDDYVRWVREVAIPKLDTILKDAESQRKEALAGKAADPDRAEAFQRNVDQLELTQTAAVLTSNTSRSRLRVLSAAIWKSRKTFVWQPTRGVRLTSLWRPRI